MNPGPEAPSPSVPPFAGRDRLVCTRCGGVTPLDAPGLLDGVQARAAARGVVVEAHSLTVYGRCWLCRASRVRA
ncbi:MULTISPECIES: hypothetical protein [unclassified Anaeromyxobacter]|uniref:hypothetical protein n=1 Tax=unclassified Anaeromyxobacter TaxID=2620896 RepID=UPI001F5A5F31|nr:MULTISPECIES: hypothetical protein [unclassified Anaeromyxobacter]